MTSVSPEGGVRRAREPLRQGVGGDGDRLDGPMAPSPRKRLLLLSLVALLLAWTGEAPPPPDVAASDVFVIAGQSNAVGVSTQAPVASSFPGSPLDSWIYRTIDEFRLANDPWNALGLASAWPTLANEWMAETGRPVVFVATAQGGTCLVASPQEWDPAAGSLYLAAIEQVAELDPGENLRAVLWYQGECEVGAGVDSETYEAALIVLAERIWEDLGVPLIAAPVSLRPPPWPPMPERVEIHDAILAAALASPYIVLGPDTNDLEHEPDGTHIHDVAELGRRWHAAILAGSLAGGCSDGVDNDGDGATDWPTDPGCFDAYDLTETDRDGCRDGIDNDGDGLVDFPADPGCTSANDAAETRPGARCDNGIDDDGDGRADFDPATLADPLFTAGTGDPGCESPTHGHEAPQCQNGLDDDELPGIDFDGGASLNGGVPFDIADPECVDRPWRNREQVGKVCGLGFELAPALVALTWLARRRAKRA